MKNILKSKPWVVIISLALVLVMSGVVYAATLISNLWTSPDIVVTVQVIPPPPVFNEPLVILSGDFTESKSVYTGVWSEATVELSNPSLVGAPGYPAVLVNFNIYDKTDNAIAPSDVVLEYETVKASGIFASLPLTQGTGTVFASFGPATGFPVGFGYNEATLFRIKFQTPGTYYATAIATTVD